MVLKTMRVEGNIEGIHEWMNTVPVLLHIYLFHKKMQEPCPFECYFHCRSRVLLFSTEIFSSTPFLEIFPSGNTDFTICSFNPLPCMWSFRLWKILLRISLVIRWHFLCMLIFITRVYSACLSCEQCMWRTRLPCSAFCRWLFSNRKPLRDLWCFASRSRKITEAIFACLSHSQFASSQLLVICSFHAPPPLLVRVAKTPDSPHSKCYLVSPGH